LRPINAGSVVATADANGALLAIDVPLPAFVRTYTSEALASPSDSDTTGVAGCGGVIGGTGAAVAGPAVPAAAAPCWRYASSAGSVKATFFSVCALFGPAVRGLAVAWAFCLPAPASRG